MIRRGVLLCILLVATAGCDRVTKHLAVVVLAGGPEHSFLADTVRLAYHENPGGFLAAGASWSPAVRAGAFQAGNGLFLLATAVVALRYRFSRLAGCGLVLFLAGGVSNLIDRVALGGVIDFLTIGVGPVRTGIFNIADVAILAGVGLLIWEAARNSSTPTVSTRAR